jgi:hypothetical protein
MGVSLRAKVITVEGSMNTPDPIKLSQGLIAQFTTFIERLIMDWQNNGSYEEVYVK